MACQLTGVSHTPAVKRGQHQLHELDAVAHHHRDVIARLESQLIEQRAQSSHPVVELGPPTRARQVIDGEGVGIEREQFEQRRRQEQAPGRTLLAERP